MIGNDNSPEDESSALTSPRRDEGGLRAPPDLRGWRKFWWWFHFIILVNLARLRFIGILLVIGVVIMKWDTLAAYYDKWTRSAEAAEAGGGDVEYFCPMHPFIIRDNPKEKCPICFMPLSRRQKGTEQAEALPAGTVSRVQLSPYRVTLAGVRTWRVDYVPLAKEITAVGFVEFNERNQRTVSARVNGRLDKLLVNETGQMVKEGDDLALIYSADLITSVDTLLRTRNREPEVYAATRAHLLRVGVSQTQIDEILSSGTASPHVRISSPIGGHVIKKYVREGQYVQTGMPLYDIADLSSVWIAAQIYEDDLAFLPVKLGHGPAKEPADTLTVTATTRSYPNQPVQGKLAFVYPHVDQETRTVTVRFELENSEHKLRPGGTATVTINIPPQRLASLTAAATDDVTRRRMLAEGRVLAVPESAIIDTGRQKIVYRQAGVGTYEGVLVELGPKMTGPDGVTYFPVLRGLELGDRIVTSGSFLVDAETRLNPAAGSIYFGGSSGGKAAAPSATSVRPSTPEDADAKIAAALANLAEPDRKLAVAQRYCPVLTDSRLGSMGPPVKLQIDGQTVFLCCGGCRKQALANPQATLATVQKLKDRAASQPRQ